MTNNITRKTNDKTSKIESIKVDNIEYYNASGITNGLCKYFANVGEKFSTDTHHFEQHPVQLINLESRLVTMSVSLRTQTVSCCLTIQVLNTRVCFLNLILTCLTPIHSNLEHGLVIPTESLNPLRSVLHNLPCWSPKQMWCNKPCYSLLNHAYWAGLNQFTPATANYTSKIKCWGNSCLDVWNVWFLPGVESPMAVVIH